MTLDYLASTLNELAEMQHGFMVEKGFYEQGVQTIERQLLNFHSEITEAWEHLREGRALSVIAMETPTSKPEGVPIEFADIILRVLDTCAANGINIGEAVKMKVKYNQTRPHRHGGKLC